MRCSSFGSLFFTRFLAVRNNVCRVPNHKCSLGQDPSFCFISPDRWYVSLHNYTASVLFSSYSIVSLQQMALFGQNPSQGTLLKGSQFLAGEHTITLPRSYRAGPSSEELPVRLAHRVKELDELPHNLSGMPSIKKVKHWYAQSFEVRPRVQSSRFWRFKHSHTGSCYFPQTNY